MVSWIDKAFFYHVYPLGYCGAPGRNDFEKAPVARIEVLTRHLDAIAALGVNALYLGPLFESVAHGYDTVDYRRVDRRLGTNEDLAVFAREAKARGMRLVLDGVFNHVGREHPWFRRLRVEGPSSPCASRFKGVDFTRPGTSGEAFSYESWNGCEDLPALNLDNGFVRNELVGAALSWIDDWDIDGLRLDAADCVDLGFQAELATACRSRKGDFWLLGEIIHGNYRRWAGDGPLDSVTNYECWKALWSSLKDGNYFEMAYALTRQSGKEGLYRDLLLYNFADNHDVDRAASLLPDASLLYPLYCLLFTMPGIPSLYYGSEYGSRARRTEASDSALRPPIDSLEAAGPTEGGLAPAIARLAALRRRLPALRRGGYREIRVSAKQLVFARESEEGWVVVALNAADEAVDIDIELPAPTEGLRDELEAETRLGGEHFRVDGSRARIRLHPRWGRVLAPIGRGRV